MKDIKLQKCFTISAFNGPTEKITAELLQKILRPVEKNKMTIIESAFDIEKMLELIIMHYFFGNREKNKEESKKFKDLILQSNWCSFSSKKNLVSYIVNEKGLLEKNDKPKYDKLLKSIMTYRNAFTHGELSTDGREVRISYFENGVQVKTIDENYLTRIESDFKECWEMTIKVIENKEKN